MTPETTMNKILIVDDHQIVRQGLMQLLNSENDLVVCGEAGSTIEALECIEKQKPNLIILDISLNGVDGLEFTKIIHKRYPDIFILIFSMHDESIFANRAIHSGAHGYVMKQAGTESVILAIHKILDGEIYLNKKIYSKFVKNMILGKKPSEDSIIHNLSDREWVVFELVGQGNGTKEISKKLTLGVKTIETHKERIKKKLGLKNAAELAQKAVLWTIQEENHKERPY